MNVIEADDTIEENRHVRRDDPLPPGVAGRVRLILVGQDEPTDQAGLHAADQGGAFDFLNAAEEDCYTLRGGRPFDDAWSCRRRSGN